MGVLAFRVCGFGFQGVRFVDEYIKGGVIRALNRFSSP